MVSTVPSEQLLSDNRMNVEVKAEGLRTRKSRSTFGLVGWITTLRS